MPVRQPQAETSNDSINENEKTGTFQEYLEKNPSKFALNHYTGDMVYANFGYVMIEGKWVDPESEGALYKAYMDCTEGHNATAAELPDFSRSRTSGPHIMTPEEEDRFYRDYVTDVTDETDGEGDPRALRISPATFARWATGAQKGDHYEEQAMSPEVCFLRYAFTPLLN
jgi:hypothetical protein